MLVQNPPAIGLGPHDRRSASAAGELAPLPVGRPSEPIDTGGGRTFTFGQPRDLFEPIVLIRKRGEGLLERLADGLHAVMRPVAEPKDRLRRYEGRDRVEIVLCQLAFVLGQELSRTHSQPPAAGRSGTVAAVDWIRTGFASRCSYRGTG